jgi:hypothetical protein
VKAFVSGQQIVGTGAWGAYSLGCLVDATRLLIAAPICSAVWRHEYSHRVDPCADTDASCTDAS